MLLGDREKRLETALIASSLAFYVLNKMNLIPLGVFAANHLNDFLAGMLLTAYANLVLCFSKYDFRFDTVPRVLLLGAFCGLAWELFAPLYLPSSTADFLDCLSYFAGCLLHLAISCWYAPGKR